jgi:hypothetical protein
MKLCTPKANLCLTIQLNEPRVFISEFLSMCPHAKLNQIEDEVEIEIPGSDIVGLEPSDWVVFEAIDKIEYMSDEQFKQTYRLLGNATRKDKGHDE